MAAASSQVKLDLNSPEFQDVFFRLELSELKQVGAGLRRLRELVWSTLYRHTGFQWETIRHIRTPSIRPVLSPWFLARNKGRPLAPRLISLSILLSEMPPMLHSPIDRLSAA